MLEGMSAVTEQLITVGDVDLNVATAGPDNGRR